jgi:hypothetical protein
VVQIRDYIEVLRSDGDKKHILAEMHVDSSSELPSREYGGFILESGSLAHDVSTGDIYAINSSGEWNKQAGGGGSGEDSIKIGLLEATTNSSGEIYLSLENAPDDFGDGSFISIREAAHLKDGSYTIAYALALCITKYNGADDVQIVVFGNPKLNSITPENIKKNTPVRISYNYVPKPRNL